MSRAVDIAPGRGRAPAWPIGGGTDPGPGSERFDRLVAETLPSLVGEARAKGARIHRSVMARMELPLLRHALELCGGNQLKAAKLLGINRNTLRKRLRRLGLLPAGSPSRARAGEGPG